MHHQTHRQPHNAFLASHGDSWLLELSLVGHVDGDQRHLISSAKNRTHIEVMNLDLGGLLLPWSIISAESLTGDTAITCKNPYGRKKVLTMNRARAINLIIDLSPPPSSSWLGPADPLSKVWWRLERRKRWNIHSTHSWILHSTSSDPHNIRPFSYCIMFKNEDRLLLSLLCRKWVHPDLLNLRLLQTH